MKYISIGAVTKPSTEHIVHVSHCGYDYTLTGEQAGSGRDTDRRIGVSALEIAAAGGQIIQIGGQDLAVAGKTDAIGSKLVSHDQDNIVHRILLID